MTHNSTHSAPITPSPVSHSEHEAHADDRWLADFGNDLGAFSLTSDEIPGHQQAEMEFVEDPRAPRPRHFDIGI